MQRRAARAAAAAAKSSGEEDDSSEDMAGPREGQQRARGQGNDKLALRRAKNRWAGLNDNHEIDQKPCTLSVAADQDPRREGRL